MAAAVVPAANNSALVTAAADRVCVALRAETRDGSLAPGGGEVRELRHPQLLEPNRVAWGSNIHSLLLPYSRKIKIWSQRKSEHLDGIFLLGHVQENILKFAPVSCLPHLGCALAGRFLEITREHHEAESAACTPKKEKDIGPRNNIHTNIWKTTGPVIISDNPKLNLTCRTALESLAHLKTNYSKTRCFS